MCVSVSGYERLWCVCFKGSMLLLLFSWFCCCFWLNVGIQDWWNQDSYSASCFDWCWRGCWLNCYPGKSQSGLVAPFFPPFPPLKTSSRASLTRSQSSVNMLQFTALIMQPVVTQNNQTQITNPTACEIHSNKLSHTQPVLTFYNQLTMRQKLQTTCWNTAAEIYTQDIRENLFCDHCGIFRQIML